MPDEREWDKSAEECERCMAEEMERNKMELSKKAQEFNSNLFLIHKWVKRWDREGELNSENFKEFLYDMADNFEHYKKQMGEHNGKI